MIEGSPALRAALRAVERHADRTNQAMTLEEWQQSHRPVEGGVVIRFPARGDATDRASCSAPSQAG